MSGSQPRHSTPNRVWRYTWRISATLVAITFVVLASVSFDEKILETGALEFKPRQIPDSENAFPIIQAAARRLGKLELERAQIYNALSGRAWDDVETSEWLRDREFAVETIHQLLRFQTAQLPRPNTILEAYNQERPGVDWIGFLACVRARKFILTGDLPQALTLQLACWHAADLIRDGRGDLLSWLHGSNIEFASLEVLYELASHPDLEERSLNQLLSRALLSHHTHAEFEQLIASNFHATRLTVNAFTGTLEEQAFVGASEAKRIAYRMPFLFKPNQTLNYVIPDYFALRERIDQPPSVIKALQKQHGHATTDLCGQYDDWINRLGKRAAHDFLYPSLSGFLTTRLRQQTRISLAQTLIAIRLYHDAHNRNLPATLDELVPRYLPAVPRDYFSGETIRYSRELRAIWSIGPENFELTSREQAVHERELILPLCFDGSYVAWPRQDPQARTFFENEGSLFDEEPPAPAEPQPEKSI